MEIEEKEKAYVFLKKQLQFAQPSSLVETNLALIVKIISSENLADLTSASSSPFNVDEKIAFNSLSAASVVIEDYKIHHHRVERIYGDFDTAGKNKSKSVLDAFRNVYLKLSVNFSGDDLYFHVVEEIIKIVHASSNHVDIPFDELELLVNVLAVDAFIRCKIFKAPGIFNAST